MGTHAYYGQCFLCGQTFSKRGMTRHLKACLSAHPPAGTGKPVRLFHLRVEGAYNPEYWLHLEIPANATLGDLDDFLREIWLECCDHLSAFNINGQTYEMDTGMVDAMWKDLFGPMQRPKSMGRRLGTVLSPGLLFFHEYDYGTTTTLLLQVMGERQGLPPEDDVRVLARNYAPLIPCSVCGEPAVYLNTLDWPVEAYCETHAEAHEEYAVEDFLPIVNSPRVGQCGYTGPEDETLKFEVRAPLPKD